MTSLEINEDATSIISGIKNGNAFIDESIFTKFENDKVYLCLNEGDNLEECEYAFLEGGVLFYQFFDLGTYADENCVEQYRLVKI